MLVKIVMTLSISMCICIHSKLHADFVQFNDLGSWSSAAGPLDFAEDFDSFTADTSFSGSTLKLNGFSIVETGIPSNDLNIIDVQPYGFGGQFNVDGTNYLAGEADFGETYIQLEFEEQVTAFGGDFRDANGPEMLGLDLLDLNGNVLFSLDPISDITFLGFVADSGESIAGVRFYSQIESDIAREAFGLDNVVGVNSVPEANLASVFAIAIFSMITRRKRF